ncbi:hypothetical protein RB5298 [Rhodopirellula baltica SH 1]|uniref:Uncharacterized protein n=1 Tax=Rhodopirellula baltica (strain DSM 10527 / NCIMB 13988 / SH1) TaxID=243090 RepID=Q7UGC8_RHOBA|nr:hypothetical protein RB5298 [Rhodopirellula baltica SH 1]
MRQQASKATKNRCTRIQRNRGGQTFANSEECKHQRSGLDTKRIEPKERVTPLATSKRY